MTKMYVPNIGEIFTLIGEWPFKLFPERRNDGMFKLLILDDEYKRKIQDKLENSDSIGSYAWNYMQSDKFIKVVLPEGAQLRVDRVYIRKGKGYDAFASLTFVWINAKDFFKTKRKPRFWAKLADVNNIDFEMGKLNIAEDDEGEGITFRKLNFRK